MVWYLYGDLKDKMIAIRITVLASAWQTIGFTDKYYSTIEIFPLFEGLLFRYTLLAPIWIIYKYHKNCHWIYPSISVYGGNPNTEHSNYWNIWTMDFYIM